MQNHHSVQSVRKSQADFSVESVSQPRGGCVEILLRAPYPLQSVSAGQFCMVAPPGGATLLRRPISINDADESEGKLRLLVRDAGRGTHAITRVRQGDILNVVYPLGNGYPLAQMGLNPLLIGGGVGAAPFLLLGRRLRQAGAVPTFLIAAQTAEKLQCVEKFRQLGQVHISTDDGTEGHVGLATQNPVLESAAGNFSSFAVCGPEPMMKAVAKMAAQQAVPCFVSLENKMACGLGACLCCVTPDNTGHNRCVCTEGPVFAAEQLGWA